MKTWRFGIACLLLTVLLILLFEQTDAQDSIRLGDECRLDGALSGTRTDWMASYEAQALTIDELKALADMAGEPIRWLPDGLYGRFDTPALTAWPVEYDVWLPDGDMQYVMIWTVAGTQYVFGFNDLAVTSDVFGQHEGAHHLCAMLVIPED